EIASGSHHVREEQRTALLEQFEQRPSHRTQEGTRRILRSGMMRPHPVRILAHKEGDWRDTRGNHAAHLAGSGNTCPLSVAVTIIIGVRCFERCWMRRQSAPTHNTAQAELIEMRRIVIRDSAAKDEALPGIRGNLESLQLAKDLERAMLAAHLRAGSDMLPAQQPVHELCRGDRLDLLAQRGDRQAMNASQQAALAPLGDRSGSKSALRR